MAKLSLKVGSTSQRAFIFIQDSTVTTGAGKTGLAYNTSGLKWYTARDDDGNAAGTAVTLATATKGTFTSGGFVEKDATNMPGVYEIGIPNAAIASGSKSAVMILFGATGMAPVVLEIELVAYDPFDAVHLGLTCLPNTAVTTNGSLITSGTGTAQISVSSGVAQADVAKINAVSTSSVTTINANVGTTQPINFTGTGATAYVKTDVIQLKGSAAAGTSGYFGISWADIGTPNSSVNLSATTIGTLTTYTGNTVQTGDAYARLGAPAGASVSADVAAVKTDTAAVKVQTDKLTFTVSNVVDANMLRTNGDATSAANVAKTTRAIGRCTVTTGASTTSIPTSACTPTGIVADQFKGRIITFDADTTTTALRGQSTDITASSAAAAPTFTVTALTSTPASGDTFSIT